MRPPRRFDESDVLPKFQGEDRGSIEAGTVGWEGDPVHYDVADDGKEPLVKVTLFRGRNPSDPQKSGSGARGRRILARVSWPLQAIPPNGSLVYVAIPAGWDSAPWGPCIIACPGVSPSGAPGAPTQFKASRVVLDFGDQVDLMIKAKSVTLSDYEDRYCVMGPSTGFKIGDATASGMCVKDGVVTVYSADGPSTSPKVVAALSLSTSKGAILSTNMGGKVAALKLKDGNCTIASKEFSAACANAMIGMNASPATPAHVGTSVPGAPSTSVFIQP